MKTRGFRLEPKKKGADAFQLVEEELMPVQGHEVRIKSEAFGINYADVMASQGLYREAPPRPCFIGYEVVGEVVEMGSEVSEDLLGKRVLAFTRFGGFMEHATTNADACVVVENQDAADLLPLATQGVTAYYMADFISATRPGDLALVHAAAGGVGSLLIQLLKSKGAQVIAKVGSDHKAHYVKTLGADLVVNYRKEDYPTAIEKAYGSKVLSQSFNAVAGDTFKPDLGMLRPGGRLFLFGGAQLSAGKYGIFSQLNFLRKMGRPLPIALMMTGKSIVGVNMLKVGDATPEILSTCLQASVDLYKNGTWKPQQSTLGGIDDFHKFFSELASGKSIGKLGIRWD